MRLTPPPERSNSSTPSCSPRWRIRRLSVDRHADPEGLGLYEGRFAPAEGLPWRRRMTFESETHVYDVYVRRPEVVVQFGDCSGGGQDLGV